LGKKVHVKATNDDLSGKEILIGGSANKTDYASGIKFTLPSTSETDDYEEPAN
jgi:hypothetical protein